MSKNKREHIEYKSFSFELKDMDEKGKFQGMLSTNGNIDPVNDQFFDGNWKRTIKNRGDEPFPLLKGHNPQSPLGSFHAKDVEQGLFINDGRFNLRIISESGASFPAVPNAYEQYALYKDRDARGLSVGFRPILSKTKFTNINGVIIRQMFESELIEGSTTPIPMNVLASVSNIKGWEDLLGILVNNLSDIDLKHKIFSIYGYDPESLATLDPVTTTPNPDIDTTHEADYVKFCANLYDRISELGGKEVWKKH